MKSFVIILSLLLIESVSIGQDTTYYNSNDEPIISTDSIDWIETVFYHDVDSAIVTVKTYTKSWEIIKEINYSDYRYNILGGKTILYYHPGQVQMEMDFIGGKQSGMEIWYWENGKIKREEKYQKGKFIKGNCFTANGQDTTFYKMHLPAEYPGGIKSMYSFFAKNIKYPEKSKEEGIQGIVVIKFVVEINGNITNVEVIRGVNTELDLEAVRLIKQMPNWKPGMQNGRPVRLHFTLPLKFRLK